MKLESKLDCEQNNCKIPAIGFIYFAGGDTLMLLCKEHENELAREFSILELEEFLFDDPDWAAKLVKHMNERANRRAAKYSHLLQEYDEVRGARVPGGKDIERVFRGLVAWKKVYPTVRITTMLDGAIDEDNPSGVSDPDLTDKRLADAIERVVATRLPKPKSEESRDADLEEQQERKEAGET